MTAINPERSKELIEEALELLKSRPEANPDLPSTETAAWRAGFVVGYTTARVEADERAISEWNE